MQSSRLINAYNRFAWPHTSDPTDFQHRDPAHTDDGRALTRSVLTVALPNIRWFKITHEDDVWGLLEDSTGVYAWLDDVEGLIPLRTHLQSYKEWMDKAYARHGGYPGEVTSDPLPGDTPAEKVRQ